MNGSMYFDVLLADILFFRRDSVLPWFSWTLIIFTSNSGRCWLWSVRRRSAWSVGRIWGKQWTKDSARQSTGMLALFGTSCLAQLQRKCGLSERTVSNQSLWLVFSSDHKPSLYDHSSVLVLFRNILYHEIIEKHWKEWTRSVLLMEQGSFVSSVLKSSKLHWKMK